MYVGTHHYGKESAAERWQASKDQASKEEPVQISAFTRARAERYRKARADYIPAEDAPPRTLEEIDEARRQYELAAQDLASSVLNDIDQCKA